MRAFEAAAKRGAGAIEEEPDVGYLTRCLSLEFHIMGFIYIGGCTLLLLA